MCSYFISIRLGQSIFVQFSLKKSCQGQPVLIHNFFVTEEKLWEHPNNDEDISYSLIIVVTKQGK